MLLQCDVQHDVLLNNVTLFYTCLYFECNTNNTSFFLFELNLWWFYTLVMLLLIIYVHIFFLNYRWPPKNSGNENCKFSIGTGNSFICKICPHITLHPVGFSITIAIPVSGASATPRSMAVGTALAIIRNTNQASSAFRNCGFWYKEDRRNGVSYV